MAPIANAEARALIAEARDVDALLDAGVGAAPGADLVTARILAAVPKAGAPAQAGLTRTLAALAACAVFGVVVGFGGAMFAPQGDATDAALSAAFGDGPEATPVDPTPGGDG